MRNERVLKFIVDGQKIKKDSSCDFSGIVRGTSGYLKAKFDVSSEYNGCVIAASFWCMGKEYAMPLTNFECNIPNEALVWKNFYVSITGMKNGYKIKTNKVLVLQEG